MRCSCPMCDTYMVQSEGSELGCVCPTCLYRCKACLGTNTVISREDILAMKNMSDDMRRTEIIPDDKKDSDSLPTKQAEP